MECGKKADLNWKDPFRQEIKLIRHGPFYYNAFIKIYGVRKDNPTKRIAVRIGRNRENYQHAWATVINEIKTRKPSIDIPETLIKEMERIQNGETVYEFLR